ncbi:MAG: DNA methyltransferase, partial [Thermotogota bacterium]|nr:DNA methyltransferase [Thermotogota bacterium]
MNRADLDFGMYRIMNAKRDEINDYLENELYIQVGEVLKKYSGKDKNEKIKELEDEKRILKEHGVDPAQSSKVQKLEQEIAQAVDTDDLERKVYSHLYTFFSRYYDKGDFISKRRYKDGAYMIPYEGEEVKLVWANMDQYYIKTSEYLRDYSFFADVEKKRRVHFKLTEAEESKDNTKTSNGNRRFALADDPVSTRDGELTVRFVYKEFPKGKDKQEEINKTTIESILGKAGDFKPFLERLVSDRSTRRVIDKHVNEYTARNSYDYFIHKDLGGFLKRELDFYIKNEVMRIEDIDSEESISRVEAYLDVVRALKLVGEKIISFLAHIEEFQKKLWLKKKFVIDSGYCVTMDKVPEELWDEVATNKEQEAEWKKLGFLENTKKVSKKWLNENPYAMIDTKFYDEKFKNTLLKSFENIDEQTDGLIINSENFQALNLLQERYKEKVKCVYIDPPYNSPSSEIIYKNNYKHSTWLSLMYDRLLISKKMQNDKGSTVVAIDENEANGLVRIMEEIFKNYDITPVSVEHNKKGVQGDHFSFTNEYAIFAISPNLKELNRLIIDESEWDYSNLRNWGGESLRSDGKNCFYPVLVKDEKVIGFGEISSDDFHPDESNVENHNGTISVYPVDADGVERKWRYARDSVEKILHLLKVEYNRNGEIQIMKAKADRQFKTMWYSSLYNAGDYGTKTLTNFGFPKGKFDFPKSIYTTQHSIFAVSNKNDIIMDYFAGSGTTAHAVINLNREDGGNRKYILVEMGQYFDTVLKPRIQKVVYADTWKNGKPVSKDDGSTGGSSHVLKYLKLESYEDTLNNLEVVSSGEYGKLKELGAGGRDFREGFMLNYFID